ncbi:MAG: hypothetical protein ABEL76_03220 [Bradymonadaceae bacterium]
MAQHFDYTDILEAETPREVTRASFWRVRNRSDARTDWVLLIPAAPSSVPLADIDREALPWELRRHLPVDPGRLSVNWRRVDEENWRRTQARLLPGVPRRIAVEVAERMECRALVRADRGRDAHVRLLGSSGGEDRSLGRDRLGMIETLDMFEVCLRREMRIDADRPLACYAVGLGGGRVSAHLDRDGARDALHERLRS